MRSGVSTVQLTTTRDSFRAPNGPGLPPAALAARLNKKAETDPHTIIRVALEHAERPVISTNFRPGSAALLHMVVSEYPNIPVIWVDTGFNTDSTLRHIDTLINAWQLNLKVFSAADRPAFANHWRANATNEPLAADDPDFDQFVEQIKLEPFRRAFATLKPDLWFTGIRQDQTAYRRSLDIVSPGINDALRVAPLLYWDAKQVHEYAARHQIVETHEYFDPSKPEPHLECGLQLLAT